jgi:hypothetical protein
VGPAKQGLSGSGSLRVAASGRRIRYSGVMAKAVEPRKLPDPEICIPGLKPPVREFAPFDDGDPSEVDAFNQMIRELRNLRPAFRPAVK